MNFFQTMTVAFMGLVLMVAPAFGQTSVGPFDEEQQLALALAEPELIPASTGKSDPCKSSAFDPSCFGIVEFETPEEMYRLLVAEGRCETLAPERQPCALLYREKVSGEGKQYNYVPVFKVEKSKEKIWTIHDGKLTSVSIETAYRTVATMRGSSAEYASFAVVGNAENRANCESGRPCLKHLVEEDMFRAYDKIPGFVVEKLWHNRMTDNGLHIR